MSPLGKGLLASALTLPLVAFVAGVLASPDSVDPDRSEPVIIGRVNDEKPVDTSTQERSRKGAPPGREDAPGPEHDPEEGPEDARDEGPDDDVTDDQPYTVVTPPPRDLDDDEDGGDDGDDDNNDDSGGSGGD